jgi:Protein of unknown function with HXXEE motif
VSDPRLVCWGLFTAWVVHDTEEVLTATWWSRQTTTKLRAEGLPGWLVDSVTTTTARFAVAAAVVGVAVLLVTRHGLHTAGRSPVFQAAVLVFGWHGLVHVGQAAILRGYVPGLVNAVLVVVPYAVWAWRAAGRTAEAHRPSIAVVIGVAVVAIALTFATQSLSGLLLG